MYKVLPKAWGTTCATQNDFFKYLMIEESLVLIYVQSLAFL